MVNIQEEVVWIIKPPSAQLHLAKSYAHTFFKTLTYYAHAFFTSTTIVNMRQYVSSLLLTSVVKMFFFLIINKSSEKRIENNRIEEMLWMLTGSKDNLQK